MVAKVTPERNMLVPSISDSGGILVAIVPLPALPEDKEGLVLSYRHLDSGT
ncbi:hypothetical protein GCM10010862_12660 [Devosia nitrariae]|uniref:Uncharacterized protein n=1 Tax=Devosia nitrariae TaxID=2071872 RepID=A0ABQ5W292_9HYPH|nr:hypothetical protein GCM10010862_12660 [Devosia nitrariae]